MLSSDLVIHNSVLCPLSELGAGSPVEGNRPHPYLFQLIHVHEHRALHLEEHLQLLKRSLRTLYELDFKADTESLGALIEQLLRANRYPPLSQEVALRIYPQDPYSQEPKMGYTLSVNRSLLYNGYSLGHQRPHFTTFEAMLPDLEHPTELHEVLLLTAEREAQRVGAELALTRSYEGAITQYGHEPVFIAQEGTLYTTPREHPISVMDLLIRRACEHLGLYLHEIPITEEMLLQCDEVFVGTTQGILSMGRYQAQRYFSNLAQRINDAL